MADCPTPEKRAYRSKAKANKIERRRRPPLGEKKTRLWPYECACGAWHLTHHRGTPSEQAEMSVRLAACIASARQRQEREAS